MQLPMCLRLRRNCLHFPVGGSTFEANKMICLGCAVEQLSWLCALAHTGQRGVWRGLCKARWLQQSPTTYICVNIFPLLNMERPYLLKEIFMCCVHVWPGGVDMYHAHAGVSGCQKKARKSPGPGITENCVSPNMGVGNWPQGLLKERKAWGGNCEPREEVSQGYFPQVRTVCLPPPLPEEQIWLMSPSPF